MIIIEEHDFYRILYDGSTWYYPEYWSSINEQWQPYKADNSTVCFQSLETTYRYLVSQETDKRIFVYNLVYSENGKQYVTGLCVKSSDIMKANFSVMIAVVNLNVSHIGYELHNLRLVRIDKELGV